MNKTLGKLNDDGWNGVEATIEKTVYKMFTVKNLNMKVIEQNFSFYKYFLGVKFTCVLIVLLLQSCDNSIINNSTDGIVIDSFKQGSRNKRNIIAFIVNNKLYKTIEIGNDVEYRDYYRINYSNENPYNNDVVEKIQTSEVFSQKAFITGENYPDDLKILIKKNNDTIEFCSINPNFGFVVELNEIYEISICKENKKFNTYVLDLKTKTINKTYSMILEYSTNYKFVKIAIKDGFLVQTK